MPVQLAPATNQEKKAIVDCEERGNILSIDT